MDTEERKIRRKEINRKHYPKVKEELSEEVKARSPEQDDNKALNEENKTLKDENKALKDEINALKEEVKTMHEWR